MDTAFKVLLHLYDRDRRRRQASHGGVPNVIETIAHKLHPGGLYQTAAMRVFRWESVR